MWKRVETSKRDVRETLMLNFFKNCSHENQKLRNEEKKISILNFVLLTFKMLRYANVINKTFVNEKITKYF